MSPSKSATGHRLALLSAAVLTVSACGGGGGGSSAPTPPAPQTPAPVSISGTVLGGAGATVCLDLDVNGACDAGEPTATADAQGAFTLAGLSASPGSGIAVVAQVPAGTSGAAYVIKAPASRASVVSPITSVVQAGVDQGMTLAQSESATALQLQVGSASLYSNYLHGTANADTEALAAIGTATVEGLRLGMPLVVGSTGGSVGDYTVRSFFYFDAQNHDVRRYEAPAAVDSTTGLQRFYVIASGLAGGSTSRSAVAGYVPQWISTSSGWTPSLNEAGTHATTVGNPSISIWSNGYRYITTRVDVDVSGLPIADVVRQAQSTTINTESTITNLTASTVTGVMPAGARVRRNRVVTVAAPLVQRTTNDYYTGASTLAALVAAFPVPATATQANTASLGPTRAPLNCAATGPSTCLGGALRAAFGAGNTVAFYLCDWNSLNSTATNCTSAGTGTYSVGTAQDNVTPMMSFTGLPTTSTQTATTRVLVERGGVYVAVRATLPTPTVTTRLYRTAFEALAGALSIPAPVVTGSASPYIGLWRTTYSGTESGQCNMLLVDATGALSGSCTSAAARTFTVGGAVSDLGSATFGSVATDSFSGAFLATSATGTWSQLMSGANGTWQATKY